MKNLIKYILSAVIFVTFGSCKFLDSKDYLIANGAWFMDAIEYNEENVKYKLMGNALFFKEDSCSVPLKQTGMEVGDDVSVWEIDEENRTITIKSKNSYFNRTFKFCFKEHKKDNVVELYMVSDSVTILAHSPNKLESGLLDIPFLCAE